MLLTYKTKVLARRAAPDTCPLVEALCVRRRQGAEAVWPVWSTGRKEWIQLRSFHFLIVYSVHLSLCDFC